MLLYKLCAALLLWPCCSQWEEWLKDFGHDDFRYPGWIRQQMQACSCWLSSGEVLCHSSLTGEQFPQRLREGSELSWCSARSSSDYVLLAQKVKKSIHYAVTHYSSDLLLKTDTDSWIFLDRLLQFAEENELFDPRRSAQAGDVRRHTQPAPGGKNIDEVFTVLTGQETYPIYSAGPGYLLTRNLCNYISLLVEDDDVNNKTDAKKESLPALTDLPQEDVSVGFWLEAVEHEQVVMPLSIWAEGCRRSAGQTLVLDHYVREAEMRRRWKNLQSSGNPCKAW
eukprot:symbB.v1.2.014103.t1/scaffold1018.1/size143800/5